MANSSNLFCFLSDFCADADTLVVNRSLLCRHSWFVNKLCEQAPTTTSLKLPRDFRNAYQAIIDYLEDDVVPNGPACVGSRPEAKQHAELILMLCYFAEFYEMDDLANRSIDALRFHEHQCSRSLVGRHFGEVYTNTRRGSKLRHYCALSTACFLFNGDGTAEEQGTVNILFRGIPGFEDDVRAAQATVREKTRVPRPDCDSPENHFGRCEFHNHRVGDTSEISSADGRTIYIGNLPYATTEEDLKTFLEGYQV
jgi:hypothetical protein